ncbi:MAG: hypothetical protein CV087_23670 [Candidatus Brocadia sp. WS118]|nr:MAG: hypothetical protein CV087_23670 [Candidatus Brocadia sp. WS118]
MKFLLDENLRPETLDFLRALGYDVDDVRQAGLSGADDETIAVYAKQTNRIIITFNYDFADMTQVFPHDLPGIIRLRIEPQIPGIIHPRLKHLLDHYSSARILGHLVTVTLSRIRFREL